MATRIPRSKIKSAPGDEHIRLVVLGKRLDGENKAVLMRLNETLLAELNQYAAGPTYAIVEIALRRLIDDLKTVDEVVLVQAESVPNHIPAF